MALVRTIRVNIRSNDIGAQAKIDEISRKAAELGRLNPTIQVKIDTAAAQAKLAVLRGELRSLGGSRSGIGGGIGGAAGAGAGVPGGPLGILLGIGGLLSPPVIGAGLGLAGFGAIALPTLAKITTALTSTGKAGKAAWAALDPTQFALGKEIQSVGQAFSSLAKSLEPLVTRGMTPFLKLARDFIPALKPLAQAGATIIGALIRPLDTLIRSPFFAKFISVMSQVGVQFAQVFGPGLASILKSILGLIMDLAPSVMTLWRALNPLVTLLVKDFAKVLAGVLPSLIKALAATFKAITPLIPPLTQLTIQVLPPLIKIISKLAIDVLPLMTTFISRIVVPTLKALSMAFKPVSDALNSFAANWSHDWALVKDIAVTVWNNVLAFFHTVPGKISGAFASLPALLFSIGKNAMNSLWSGLKSIASGILSWLAGLASKIGGIIGGLLGSGGGSSGGPSGGAPAANAALARRMVPAWGSGANWSAWNNVAMAESGWSQFAENASGAYGIPQALPPTKMPFSAQKAGGSNPGAQIAWMAQYMLNRYGGPQQAWAFHLSHGWYDKGGWLPPGTSIAHNNTGRPERIPAPGEGGGLTINNLYVTAPDAATLVRTLQAYAARNGGIRLKVRS